MAVSGSALWNETARHHAVTLTLPTAAYRDRGIRSGHRHDGDRNSPATPEISVSLGSDPLLIEVVVQPAQAAGSGTTTTGGRRWRWHDGQRRRDDGIDRPCHHAAEL